MNPAATSSEQSDLSRFLLAQDGFFETALSELRRGRKETHWMWFIFPQLDGLGRSAMARRYAIRNLEEAGIYLEHPVLGARLLECCRLLLSINGRSASQIFGDPDDIKLRSSMTLFSLVPGAPPEFSKVLETYFGGVRDGLTQELLKSSMEAL